MNAVKVETTVDEAAAAAIPALRPLLGKRIELIAIAPEAAAPDGSPSRLSLEELLARRVDAPRGSRPLTEEDIRRAIIEGAIGGNV